LKPGALNSTLKETLAADRQTVFIGGTDALGGFFVSAHDAGTGTLRWQDHVDDGALTGLLLHDAEDDGRHGKEDDRHGKEDERLLLATGVVGCDPLRFLDCELAIRAYSPRKGRLLWKRADKAAGGDWFYPRIEAGLGTVFIGARELLADGLYHGTIRAYQVATGRRAWTTAFDPGSGFPDSGVNDLVVFEGRLYAGGHLGRGDGDFDFVVRAYKPH
jgi:outer membrane protein assembly factor BamB